MEVTNNSNHSDSGQRQRCRQLGVWSPSALKRGVFATLTFSIFLTSFTVNKRTLSKLDFGANQKVIVFELYEEAKNRGKGSEEAESKKSLTITQTTAVPKRPPHSMQPFCQHWDPSVVNNRTLQPIDVWLTHHPTWVVSNETKENFCVEPGNVHKNPYIRGLLQFYTNQFHSLCDRVHLRGMWGSGWGADFSNIQSGLVVALNNHVPLIMQDSGIPWNYAANKNDSSALSCEAGDTTCYFLPYHDCQSSSAKYWDEQNRTGKVELVIDNQLLWDADIGTELGRSAYLFMTRKMLWFRRAVFDYKQHFKETNNITANSDCTVVHIRRGDAILDESTRRYFPVADYVKYMNSSKLSNPNHYIFLLTDDARAIDEANEFFPNLNWKYFSRPRHRSKEGGWENHTPSHNPALEVVIIVATFELVQECSAIVWGHSTFADYLYNHMLLAKPGDNVESYRVEGDRPVFDRSYNNSEAELEKFLSDMRTNRSGTDNTKVDV